MKAMVLTGIRSMEMRDVPTPAIQKDTDVLLKLSTVGVCGSDVHYFATGRIGSQVVKYPFTVGHECSAVVEKVGSAVTDVAPGDRVAVEPAMSCFNCDQCNKGRINTCRSLTFLGCPGQAEGCLSEYIVMPHECCIKIPDQMSMDVAALVEPLSIGVYAVQQSVPMKGAKVAILGSGPIGLSTLVPALTEGAEKVYVTDKIDSRLDIARNAGAGWVGNPDTTDIVAEIAGAEPQGLDAVYECCGQQEAIDQAIELLAPGGKLMLTGIPTVDRISFAIDKMRRKEISIQNVRRQCHCVEPAIELASREDLSWMITHHFSFDQTVEAFNMVDNYEDGVIKAMINFD